MMTFTGYWSDEDGWVTNRKSATHYVVVYEALSGSLIDPRNVSRCYIMVAL